MPVPGPNELPLYSGTWDCAKKTITKEGIRGLYKGTYVCTEHYTNLLSHQAFSIDTVSRLERYFYIFLSYCYKYIDCTLTITASK